ncbi:hypothetical protein O0544_03430 [Edwardsiella anguillarum]|nr:hypothetical protein [Edwardsiella anguillarum]
MLRDKPIFSAAIRRGAIRFLHNFIVTHTPVPPLSYVMMRHLSILYGFSDSIVVTDDELSAFSQF